MSRRPLTARLKTARGRTGSSQRWLTRQINDPLVQRARQEGWRARSVFKLQELDQRFDLLKRGARVLDLGAAPGSWSQYAARRGCRVVAVDLQPVEPIAGVELVTGDFLDPAVQADLRQRLDGHADLVLSDMAAPATGQRTVDRLRAEALGEAVLEFAAGAMAPGGALALKLVKGSEAVLARRAQELFATARVVRPKATRAESSEVFLVARGFKSSGDAASRSATSS